MRSLFSFVFLAIFAVLPPSITSAAPPSPVSTQTPAAATSNRLAAVAPADAYFGPFGMSPLSIRSTIGLLGRQYHYRTISDHDLLRKALITEDALRRWRTKYPADPWLAPTFFHLEQLYQAVQSDEARKHATAILNDVIKTYPNSKEGHLSRSRLASGFPALVPETPLASAPAPAEMTTASPAAGSPQPAGSLETTPPAGSSPGLLPSPLSSPTP